MHQCVSVYTSVFCVSVCMTVRVYVCACLCGRVCVCVSAQETAGNEAGAGLWVVCPWTQILEFQGIDASYSSRATFSFCTGSH